MEYLGPPTEGTGSAPFDFSVDPLDGVDTRRAEVAAALYAIARFFCFGSEDALREDIYEELSDRNPNLADDEIRDGVDALIPDLARVAGILSFEIEREAKRKRREAADREALRRAQGSGQ